MGGGITRHPPLILFEHRATVGTVGRHSDRWDGMGWRRIPTAIRFTVHGRCDCPTCAVQMFDVALSRRMCCSRVCMAMRNARLP